MKRAIKIISKLPLAASASRQYARTSKYSLMLANRTDIFRARTSNLKSYEPQATSICRHYSTSNDTESVLVPHMGDSISEGTVVEWLKMPGDYVEVDDVIVVLETDKVSVDVRSESSGIIGEHMAKLDDVVHVGAPLVTIVKGSRPSKEGSKAPAVASNSSTASMSSSAPAPTSNPVSVPVPSMGDSISEGTITEWVKVVGDHVNTDDIVVVLETDKVSVDVRAIAPGKISQTFGAVDDVVKIGVPLFAFIPGEAKVSSTSTPVEEKKPVEKTVVKENPTKKSAPKTPAPTLASVSSTDSNGAFSNRNSRREKMSRMRLRIAERLKESQNVAASLTTFQEVDMGNLMELRKKYKDAFEEKHGVKLGFMSAFITASAKALLEVPTVNAMIDDKAQEIVLRDYVDISVAVATPKGLVTPVIQNTESMSFAEIEKKLNELANKARNGNITLDELTGGNFSISNGGVFGSLMGTPILNRPQSAILGMHATKMRPIMYNGEIVARPMMYLALTYDHRLVDGREAVTCLKSIANKIENPERLLLDL